jgi:hypothetical protein
MRAVYRTFFSLFATLVVLGCVVGCKPNASDYQSLTPEEARRLAFAAVPLHFSRLKNLKADSARELATYVRRGETIFFPDDFQLSSETATELSRGSCDLWFHVDAFTQEAAKALQPHGGHLCVETDGHLEPSLAKALSGHQGSLRIIGLREVTADNAAELSQCPSALYLLEMEHVGAKAASKLRQHNDLQFDSAKNPNMQGYVSLTSRKLLEKRKRDVLEVLRENADRGFVLEYYENKPEAVVGPPFHGLLFSQKEALLRQIADYVYPDESIPCEIVVYGSEYDSRGKLHRGEKIGVFVRNNNRADSGFKTVKER